MSLVLGSIILGDHVGFNLVGVACRTSEDGNIGLLILRLGLGTDMANVEADGWHVVGHAAPSFLVRL